MIIPSVYGNNMSAESICSNIYMGRIRIQAEESIYDLPLESP